jgi:hypothetical protein
MDRNHEGAIANLIPDSGTGAGVYATLNDLYSIPSSLNGHDRKFVNSHAVQGNGHGRGGFNVSAKAHPFDIQWRRKVPVPDGCACATRVHQFCHIQGPKIWKSHGVGANGDGPRGLSGDG